MHAERWEKSVRWPLSRVLSPARRRIDGHSSGTAVADCLSRPTRTAIRKRITCRPYLVLLPVGLAMPFLLPDPRCALTAPFQPYSSSPFRAPPQQAFCKACPGIAATCSGDGRYNFCGAFPRVAPGGCYPSPCFRGARTFLPATRFVPCRASPAKHSYATERPSGHLTQGRL